MCDLAEPLTFCVDGGGTRSRGRLVDREGRALAFAESGPCNPSTNRARALASLADLWAQCCSAAGRDPDARSATTLAVGAAGLYVPAARDAFLAECPSFAGTSAMSDGYAALIGAGRGEPCALAIIGTGIAGHRLYADGRSIQRDAWGWVAGDRGSAAWFGRAALRHCFAALDGIVAHDGLSRAVLSSIGGTGPIAAGWLRDLGPDRLGALAPTVFEQASLGEPHALAIRDRAVEHLASLIRVLDAAGVPLYAAGGLVEPLRPLLEDRIGRDIRKPEADALAGCWLVASGQAPQERASLFGNDGGSKR